MAVARHGGRRGGGGGDGCGGAGEGRGGKCGDDIAAEDGKEESEVVGICCWRGM